MKQVRAYSVYLFARSVSHYYFIEINMGTRNLTVVKLNKKTKVAQYGQWDGYPAGQGQNIASFLKKADLKKFKKQVSLLKKYTQKDVEKAYIEAGAKKGAQFVSMTIANAVDSAHPALCRDHGARILNLIHEGIVTKVLLNEGFKKNTLSCEYWYEIDLNKKTVRINGSKQYSFKEWISKGFMKKLERLEQKEQ